MAHGHEPVVNHEQRFQLDDFLKKVLTWSIIVGVVCIVLGIVVNLNGPAPASNAKPHGSVDSQEMKVLQTSNPALIAEEKPKTDAKAETKDGGTKEETKAKEAGKDGGKEAGKDAGGHGGGHGAAKDGGHGAGGAHGAAKDGAGGGHGDAHGAAAGNPHAHQPHGTFWVVRLLANSLAHTVFFLCIPLLCLFFIAVKNVTRGGWHLGFVRVPEAMAHFIYVPMIPLLLIFLAGKTSLYEWTIDEVVKGDPLHILEKKAWWLNLPFFLLRNVIFFGVWAFFLNALRKASLLEDTEGGLGNYNTRFKYSIIFVILFALSFSAFSWDWLMSIEAHWFSTIFGVYVFASSWVSAICLIMIITITLYTRGYLQHLNLSHFHDLGRHIFGFSIFWAYIWFSQFLLIWYANIPEETIYYYNRLKDYPVMFFLNMGINFIFPFLMLMTRYNMKHLPTLALVASVVFLGHWNDFLLMVMPGTVGSYGAIGFMEIGFLLVYLGAFGLVTANFLSKAPLVPKNHPYLRESLLHEV